MRLHWPKFYKYGVPHTSDVVVGLNRYGWKVIGAFVSFGDYAYCVKWAWAGRRVHRGI